MGSLKCICFSNTKSFNDWNEEHPNIEIHDIKVINVNQDNDAIYLFYRDIPPKPLSRVQRDLLDSFYGYDCPCS